MIDIHIKIEFHSPWHCGSGLAAGSDIDALVITDRAGMPFVPGKTIKGLVRQAVEEYIEYSNIARDEKNGTTIAERVRNMFGEESSSDAVRASGAAHFSDANLDNCEYGAIAADSALRAHLFNKVTSTAIDDNGIARGHSLRSLQTVVPCTLYADISYVDADIADIVVKSLGMIKHMGQKRHRGLGRCTISQVSQSCTASAPIPTNDEKLQFSCKLLSDIVLNQKSSTEGNNTSLDFIPGNTFLGIVAKHYQDLSASGLEMIVFHSGSVRFGDAHPTAGNQSVRSLHVPASFYHPKLMFPSERCYIHHIYSRDRDQENDGRPQQLKQCRTGFYAFADNEGFPIAVDRTFAIKSAYDRDKRRAKDEQMYGYESLCKGAEFLFEVDIDEKVLVERGIDIGNLKKLICSYLKGTHCIGRSRTAQYGLVEIAVKEFDNVESEALKPGQTLATVYADSRLIFLDENLEPTFHPTAKQLGIADGKIDWTLSQVRTFQYAPWNGIRASRDNDRCGIEKGSVFVVRVPEGGERKFESRYIGSYCNEGFGKVIYNPDFLAAAPDKNGEIKYRLHKDPTKQIETAEMQTLPTVESQLFAYLRRAKTDADAEEFIYRKVNDFVDNYSRYFCDNKFASQWGTIRSLAMRLSTYEDIMLYVIGNDNDDNDDNDNDNDDNAYITHGVAKAKWKKFRRGNKLKDFISDINNEKEKFGDITCRAIINLSSEMAKQCKKDEKI